MEIINVIMFTCCAVNRVLYLWLTFANLQVIPCMVSNNNNKKSQKCSAKKWWYPLCLIIQHFAEILVAVMRRLIYFPTVTALKPNCPQVSWLSPTQLSCCPFEKWTDITRTNFKSFFFFFSWKQAKWLSSSLWCVYQTCWNIVLNWAPVASISQDKRLFRFPVTLVHYHTVAPANIFCLLPTYIKVLFNRWNRGSAFPGHNPLCRCRKGVIRALPLCRL